MKIDAFTWICSAIQFVVQCDVYNIIIIVSNAISSSPLFMFTITFDMN